MLLFNFPLPQRSVTHHIAKPRRGRGRAVSRRAPPHLRAPSRPPLDPLERQRRFQGVIHLVPQQMPKLGQMD